MGGMYATTSRGCGSTARAQYVAWIKQVRALHATRWLISMSQVVMADMATKGAGLVDCPRCGHPWWVAAVRNEVSCPESHIASSRQSPSPRDRLPLRFMRARGADPERRPRRAEATRSSTPLPYRLVRLLR